MFNRRELRYENYLQIISLKANNKTIVSYFESFYSINMQNIRYKTRDRSMWFCVFYNLNFYLSLLVFGESIGKFPREFRSESARAVLSLFKGFLLTTTYRGLIVVVSQNVQNYLGYTEVIK